MPSTTGHGPELARWREAREWWNGDSYVEIAVKLDTQGIRRVHETALASLGQLPTTGQRPLEEDHREEWNHREHKIRDEKVSAACGALPRTYYERLHDEREKAGPLSRERLQHQVPNGRPQPMLPPNLADTAWSVILDAPDQTAKHTITTEGYVPLHTMSGYAFGRSSMLAEEVAAYAAQCGCPAAAIADPHSLVGCVEFAKACHRNGVKPLIGATFSLPDGSEIVLIARSKRGYVSLSRLITECHLHEPRCYPMAHWARLERHSADLLCLTGGDLGPIDRRLARRDFRGARDVLERLIAIYGHGQTFLEVERSYLPWGIAVERHLHALADECDVLALAGGVVTHARPEHFPAQDVLLCAESLCRVEEILGRKPRRDPTQGEIPALPERSLNAERYLRTSSEMAALYADRPELLANTQLIAEMCDADVLPGRTRLPSLFPDDNHALREIVEAEALRTYGAKYRARPRKRIAMEVDRMIRLGFASHFLVAWDFCRWAREQGIGMSGRGSVVDSAVAYVLGLSRIDAIAHNLHFDRFLPEDGMKRPDIDVDFEARRRDDVRGYMVRRYGVERVGTVCAIGAYRTRGIVREVGKVFGLPDETIGFLAKRIHGGVPADQIESALDGRPELRGSPIPRERFRWVFHLAQRLMDVPTNIRTHSSGVVITDGPIRDTVPVMWSATPAAEESQVEDNQLRMIQWDKRTAKHYFDKFDILCLRGQDVLGGVEARVRTTDLDFSAESVPATNDPEVYRAMRSGELIGIPQSASPAMRQAHVRLKTDNLHDASLVQAGIRPGVGGAVKINELIARRRGKPFSFEHPDFEKILGLTYGIIVFQEQVDQLLQTFCGYTSGQAEDIRDAIHKRRREDFGQTIRDKLLERTVARGYPPVVAEKVFEYVAGFKGYGFAQGHALAFAEVSLRSVWMMQNKPAEYFAALLSAQPAGYYGPCTIANEARGRGVKILPLDVNRSRPRFEVEPMVDPMSGLTIPNAAVRVGWMQLQGLSSATTDRIQECQTLIADPVPEPFPIPLSSEPHDQGAVAVAVMGREDMRQRLPPMQAFGSIFDFAAKVSPSRDELEAMILSGAFDRLHSNRRALLWSIRQIQEYAHAVRPTMGTLPFDVPEPHIDPSIEDFRPEERSIHERAYLGLDIDQHLMAYERSRIQSKNGLRSDEVKRLPPGSRAIAVGNPIRLRFPPTSSGKRVVFFDLEDEAGLLNVTCFDDTYQRDGHAIVTRQYVTVVGTVQDRDGYPAFLASRVFAYKPVLSTRSTALPITAADFLVG